MLAMKTTCSHVPPSDFNLFQRNKWLSISCSQGQLVACN